ncbi:DUF2971 domain-containing protein [Lentilitoribacter sp. Alg239-R112]|uniref:DUF2971 domain-containing protein n=1 Tax=Lentilitoribacter sp. Alg239-R112 TaxID=2305987 RepID=UPI0018D6222B|nr:DUF2971 domain-containing protein [Lentilitoribacter sp. Alg239-R112]
MLYKYAETPRFFEEGLIRFTQPDALNDPDEARPRVQVNAYSEEDISNAYAQAKNSEISTDDTIIDDEFVKNFFLTPFPSARMDEKSFPGLWPAREPRLRNKPFETLEELDQAIAERALELSVAIANNTIGILSLSRSEASPMWAHYGGDHKGVSIAFDDKHPDFQANVRAIEYSDLPTYVTSNHGVIRICGVELQKEDILNGNMPNIPEEIFFRKMASWAYEKEWRQIRSLRDSDYVVKQDGKLDIHLFRISPVAVKELCFGLKASNDFVRSGIELLKGREIWDHIRIYRQERRPTGEIVKVQVS